MVYQPQNHVKTFNKHYKMEAEQLEGNTAEMSRCDSDLVIVLACQMSIDFINELITQH